MAAGATGGSRRPPPNPQSGGPENESAKLPLSLDPRQVGAAVVFVPTLVVVMAWPRSTAADVCMAVGAAVLCVAAWLGFGRHHGAPRRAWLFVGLGMTVWLAGDAVYLIAPVTPDTTGLAWPDAGWLLGYPLLSVGIVHMVRLRAPGQLREGLLDCLVMVTGAMVAAWQLLVVPQTTGKLSSVQTLVQAFYPLADMTVFGAVVLLVMSPGRRGAPTRLLVFGVCLELVGDLVFDVLPRMFPQLPMERFYLFPAIGNFLIAGAAVHPGNDELTSPGPSRRTQLHPARLVFLGVALLTTPAVAVFHAAGSSASRLVLLAAIAIIGAAVLARFVYAVREQEAAQRQLVHQASHDQLTGLANRQEFTARLEHALAGARPGDRLPGVLFLDLDGFKPINDTHGHEVGDAVLVEVAQRLKATVRATDLVARLGGDEFVVLCADADADALTRLAGRVVDAVAAPVRYGDENLPIGASVGLAIATSGEGSASVLRTADAAMYDAKRLGRGRWAMRTAGSEHPAEWDEQSGSGSSAVAT